MRTPSLSGQFPPIHRSQLEILQINLGYRCNQACTHCHVEAGPNRSEMMELDTVNQVINALQRLDIKTLDLTGGAPELNPHFRHLVHAARALGVHVIDRCNLTILYEPGQDDLAEFLASHNVEINASLPCYQEENVDAQRGRGIFKKSIAALRHLNTLGYGIPGSDLILDLVYNPQGAILPPPQESLEEAYKKSLFEQFGIKFNHLYCLCNMPIKRFAHSLDKDGALVDYMALLQAAYRAENLPQVMCRALLSVDWRGFVYDCDFNQQLELPLLDRPGAPLHGASLHGAPLQIDAIFTDMLTQRKITTGRHCFACTAGEGSSCGGALNTAQASNSAIDKSLESNTPA